MSYGHISSFRVSISTCCFCSFLIFCEQDVEFDSVSEFFHFLLIRKVSYGFRGNRSTHKTEENY